MDDYLQEVVNKIEHEYEENDQNPVVDMLNPSYETQEIIMRSIMRSVIDERYLSYDDPTFNGICKEEMIDLYNEVFSELYNSATVLEEDTENNMLILDNDSMDYQDVINYFRVMIIQELLTNWSEMYSVVLN